MPDIPQHTPNVPLAAPQPHAPDSPDADPAKNEDLLNEELARLTPPNKQLLELANKSPPPPEWLDEEEELPF